MMFVIIYLFLVAQLSAGTVLDKLDGAFQPNPDDAATDDRSYSNNLEVPVQSQTSQNSNPADTNCKGTELILHLLTNALLGVLSEVETDKAIYILKSLKQQLNDVPESLERDEINNKMSDFEKGIGKRKVLRMLYEPELRTHIVFKNVVPNIDQQNCKNVLANLLQNAYNTYLQLSATPYCQHLGNDASINLFIKHLPNIQPQDRAFDIELVKPYGYQPVPNNDIYVYGNQNTVQRNPYLDYAQNQGLPTNSKLVPNLPNGLVIKGLPLESQNPDLLTQQNLLNNLVSESNKRIYLGNLAENPVKDTNKLPEIPNVGNNNLLPPLNILLESINKQNVPKPEDNTNLDGIKQLLQEKGQSEVKNNDNNNNLLIESELTNIIRPSDPNYVLPKYIVKPDLSDANKKPDYKDLYPVLIKYLLNNKVLPNAKNLDELVKMLPHDVLAQYFPNQNTNQVNPESGGLEAVIALLPKELRDSLFPNGVNTVNFNQVLELLNANPNLLTQLGLQANNQNLNPLQILIDALKAKNGQPDLSNTNLLVPNLEQLLNANNQLKPTLTNSAGVIELTYLLKRPKPLIYQPYYYVKYKFPYYSFLNNMYSMLAQNPSLRSNPKKLYHDLITMSNFTEISPDLKGVDNKYVSELILNNGALVKAKILNGNDTFVADQLRIIKNINTQPSVISNPLLANSLRFFNNLNGTHFYKKNSSSTSSPNLVEKSKFIGRSTDLNLEESTEKPPQ